MSNLNRMNESGIETKHQEIVMLLQIQKSVYLGKNTTLGDLRKLSNHCFNNQTYDFTAFIKDFEISALENMNAIRAFDYYKSKTLIVYPKSTSTTLLILGKNSNDSTLNDLNDIDNLRNSTEIKGIKIF